MLIPKWLKDLLTEPATYSAMAALFAASAALLSYRLNRRTLSAKLVDRIYDLDKLIMANAACFKEFVDETTRQEADYFASSTRDAKYHILKVFAYYYLNLFDEIWAVYGSKFWRRREWKAWQHYILSRLGHPLIKEVLITTCHLEEQGEVLVRRCNQPSVFNDGFVRFCCDNYRKWKDVHEPQAY